jgi:hypothetical protein
MAVVLAGLVAPALAGGAESRRYDLVRRIYRDGDLTFEATAISSHTILAGEPGRELVGFERYVKYAGRQPIDLSTAAARFPAFSLSADSESLTALPDFKGFDPTLAGTVRDLRTVFLAVGPESGWERMRAIGESALMTETRKTSWTDESVPVGQDCSRVTVELTGLTPSKAVVKTTFSPPASPCLVFKKPWMEAPFDADGQANNYQEVAVTGGRRKVAWGAQQIVVTATLERATGKLLAAELDHTRTLKERTACDVELDHCSPETPVLLRRTLKLSLRASP